MIRKVTLIGLGAMGMGIAQSILRGEFDLTVYNRTIAKTESMVKAGAKSAESPREAVAEAKVVISMVADDSASRQIWLAEDGAVGGVRPDAILVECSTLSIPWILELASLAAQRGLSFLDAPLMTANGAREVYRMAGKLG